MRNLRNNQGFTLIELMIVVVIIGILAAIAIPKFSSVSRGAKQAEAAPVLKQMCSLAESYFLREDAWPADKATLTEFSEPNAEYFTFEIAGSTATASPNDAGTTAELVEQTMDCDTGELSDPTA